MSTPNIGGEPPDIENALDHAKAVVHYLSLAVQSEHRAEDEVRKAEHESEEALAHRETEIIVNSRPREIPGKIAGFEQVVQLAFPGAAADNNTVYSMTYRHAAAHPHAGELGPGGKVKVKKGTVFNVTRTVRS